jgi:diguanylate cyclase
MGTDRVLRWAVLGCAALLIVIAVLYIEPVYEAVGWRIVAWIYNSTVVLSALAGAGLALLLWRASDPGEVLKRVWGSLGVGLLLWAFGEAIWAYYQLALKEGPTVSVADVAWGVAYIPLVLSLFWRYRSLQAAPTRKQLQVGLGAFGVLTLVVLVLVIAPMIASDDFDSGAEKFVLIFYPLGDLAIALLALLSMLVLAGGTLYRPVVVITIGFLAVAISDLVYSYANWQGNYLNQGVNGVTTFVDISYVGSYLIVALGLLMQARVQRVI